MKRIFTIFALLALVSMEARSQDDDYRIKTYDGILWSSNDSFYVKESKWDEHYTFSISQKDTIDLGTDGFEGAVLTVWTDVDTLRVPYVNVADKQWLYIKIASKNHSTIYRLRFNEPIYIIDEEYITKCGDNINIAIPKVYELANIALYLSTCSDSTSNKPKTNYTKEVEAYFKKMQNHPLIKTLNEKCATDAWGNYYGFRESSICYSIDKNGFLKCNTPYKHVYFGASPLSGGEFGELLYLVQDFLMQSNFLRFYESHQVYYNQLCERQNQLLPARKMWTWLEQEFPGQYNFYNIIFSPLIGGSHSTQRYQSNTFKECIMFINSSETIDINESTSEKLKEGLMSAILFTEIDHNYVNPTTDIYTDEIKALFSNKDKWATQEAQKHYNSEKSIFNEYMTHAVFCIYAHETFDAKISEQIIQNRNLLMLKRGFPQFDTFQNLLLQTMIDRKKRISELYPLFLQNLKKM
jgi:hypothetical protein